MKRLCLIIFLTVLLVLSAVPAMAGTAGYTRDSANDSTNLHGTVTYNKTNDNYSVSYTNSNISGSGMYLLVITTGNALSVLENITYIDQVNNPTGNTVSFQNFIPMSTDKPSTVWLTGTGLTSAVKLGELDRSVVKKTVSGTVKYVDMDKSYVTPVTVTLKSGSETVATTTTGTNGAYTLENVPVGTYSLELTKARYLKYTLTGLVVADNDVTIPEIDISGLIGNVIAASSGPNQIISDDLATLLADWYHTSTAIQNANADLNENGQVEHYDLGCLLSAWYKADKTEVWKGAE